MIAFIKLMKAISVGKRIRTPDLLVRSQTLYPAELCPQIFFGMPAIGIEPILCHHNRILSPARLPVPPRGHFDNMKFPSIVQKQKNTLPLMFVSTTHELIYYRYLPGSDNGWRWIRTTEAICSRFTVCPLWPLGNPSIWN